MQMQMSPGLGLIEGRHVNRIHSCHIRVAIRHWAHRRNTNLGHCFKLVQFWGHNFVCTSPTLAADAMHHVCTTTSSSSEKTVITSLSSAALCCSCMHKRRSSFWPVQQLSAKTKNNNKKCEAKFWSMWPYSVWNSSIRLDSTRHKSSQLQLRDYYFLGKLCHLVHNPSAIFSGLQLKVKITVSGILVMIRHLILSEWVICGTVICLPIRIIATNFLKRCGRKWVTV